MTAKVLACASLLLLQGFSAILGKYVYVKEAMKWNEAQSYCRRFYTDLAPVGNEKELKELRNINAEVSAFWTGLVRNETDSEKWRWSGGGEASTNLWGRYQPNDSLLEDVGMMINNEIYSTHKYYWRPFFCFNAIVVRERANWEEALDHCRERHSDLASVTSLTEMLLIHRELEKNLSTEYTWLGLRFFPVGWRWVDKEDLKYEVWSRHERPMCPAARHRCAALKVMGWTPNATNIDGFPGTNNTVSALVGKADVWEESMWEAYDCEQRNYFVCY
ncbi:putative C-type lectin domain family 20 member A [Stigmatopora nigra]